MALWCCDFIIHIKYLLMLMIIGDAWYQLQRMAVLKHRHAVVKLSYEQEQWRLYLRDGTQCLTQLQQLIQINQTLILLKFTGRVLFLFRDSIEAKQLHQLKVIAKINKAPRALSMTI